MLPPYMSDRRQVVVINNIASYLRSKQRPEDFISQFEEGYCSGISTLWLYSKWLETQPNPKSEPRDDYAWFSKTLDLIAHWQEPEKNIVQKLNEIKKEVQQANESKKEHGLPKQFLTEGILAKIKELEKTDGVTAQTTKKTNG